jgi:predicted nucleotidyltransferase
MKSTPHGRAARSLTGERAIDVLFNTTQQRVLSELFLHPDRAYQTTELIAKVGTGSGAVQRLLARLAAADLVTRVPHGRRQLYRANRDAPLFPELRGLLLKTVGLVNPLRAALTPFAEQLRFAIVYGSIAKGTERASSDIDILIVGDGLRLEDVFEAFQPVERQLGRRIHPTLYSGREFDQRLRDENPFLTKVLAGEHIKLIGEPDGPPETR